MTGTRLPAASPCPGCGASLSGASAPSDDAAQPSPGDPSICFYCGLVLVFGEQLEQRPMAATEIAALPADLRLQLETLRGTIAAFWRSKGYADGKGPPPELERPT